MVLGQKTGNEMGFALIYTNILATALPSSSSQYHSLLLNVQCLKHHDTMTGFAQHFEQPNKKRGTKVQSLSIVKYLRPKRFCPICFTCGSVNSIQKIGLQKSWAKTKAYF